MNQGDSHSAEKNDSNLSNEALQPPTNSSSLNHPSGISSHSPGSPPPYYPPPWVAYPNTQHPSYPPTYLPNYPGMPTPYAINQSPGATPGVAVLTPEQLKMYVGSQGHGSPATLVATGPDRQGVVYVQQVAPASQGAPVALTSPVRQLTPSYNCLIALSCYVFWFCGMLFGGLAFIYAVSAKSSAESGDLLNATRYHKASWIMSCMGVAVGLILIFVVVIVNATDMNTCYGC